AGQILPDGEGQREERRGAAPGLRAAGVHGRPLSLARGVAHVPRPAEDRSRVPDRRILRRYRAPARGEQVRRSRLRARSRLRLARCPPEKQRNRSEEHTSELQSLAYLVCRLLLEKKKKKKTN